MFFVSTCQTLINCGIRISDFVLIRNIPFIGKIVGLILPIMCFKFSYWQIYGSKSANNIKLFVIFADVN